MNNYPTIIVGVDFSKEKFNACLLMDSETMGESEFPNDVVGYRDLVKWVRVTSRLGRRLDPSSVLFCGEHTGACSIGLSDFLSSRGYAVWLANPCLIKRAAGLTRVKTDRADARMIAVYAKRNYENGVTALYAPDSPDLKRLRSLYVGRNGIVRDRVAMNNRLKSGAFDASATMRRVTERRIREAKRDEKALEKEMVGLMESSPELAPNYRILISFPGVGPLTAAVFIIYTSNFRKFVNPRKFSCFCGVAPFGEQSGTSIDRKPHVSKYAHLDVKAALVQACMSAMKFNPVIREYALRLRDGGKHEGVILNNVKNKIIHILFRMIQTRTVWNPNHRQERDRHTNKDVEPEMAVETVVFEPAYNRMPKTTPARPTPMRKGRPLSVTS